MINRAALNPTVVLPLPRVSRSFYLLGAALLLLVLQLLSGTGAIYALLVFALLLTTYFAVRWAGGLQTLFGIAIFYLLLQNVLISQIAKVCYWEAADTRLRQPIITLGVYVVGMISISVGVRLANQFRLRGRPFFPPETKPQRLFWLGILCTTLSTVLTLALHTAGTAAQTGGAIQGGILGPLMQISLIGPLAVACGTAYIIKSSGGRHSFGWLNGIPMVVQSANGIVGAGREGIVNAVIIYVLTCIAFRYRFRPKHYILLVTAAYIANFILFPYALIARNTVRTGNFEENIKRSASMMADIIQDPFKYRKQVDEQTAKRSKNLTQFDYYSHPSASLNRYTNISWVDAIVDATINHGTTGWETITPGFAASLPRFINPDKPYVQTGNVLAHREPGLMPDKHDVTTGISLCFFADAFSSFEWLGISVIPGLAIFCIMGLYRVLINDRIWGNVFLLSMLVQIIVGFSEGTIAGLIEMCIVGVLATGVGLSILCLSAAFLDRLTNRIQSVWSAKAHVRQKALQRIASRNLPLSQ